MGGQDRRRGTGPIPQHLLDCGLTRFEWGEQRRILRLDIAFASTEKLSDIVYGEWIKQFDPCIVMNTMDMGSFNAHFAGGLVDGVYCTSSISGLVFDLMIAT